MNLRLIVALTCAGKENYMSEKPLRFAVLVDRESRS